MTLAELSVGPLVASDETERVARQLRLQQAEASFEPLPFDEQAARSFGGVPAPLRRNGRNTKSRAFDAMIAGDRRRQRPAGVHLQPPRLEGIDGLRVEGVPHPDERD